MPLVLNANNTVTGVFEGQGEPLEIGNVSFDLGPHKIGFTQIDDSVTMQAFFDPSLSQKNGHPSENYNCVTYIQVGQFHINGTSLPVSIHNNTPPYPVNDEYSYYSHKPKSSWVDICKFSSNENPVTIPYYPLWIWQNDAGFDHNKLFKYPQRYGGFTRYDGQPFSGGDNLCAYMKSHVDLRFIDIPCFIPDYFENLDISGLITIFQFPDELPQNPGVGFPYGLDLVGILNELVRLNILPPPSPNPGLHFFSSKNNRFITYYTNFLRENASIPAPINIVIFPNSEGKYVVAYLDYSPYELYEQDKQLGLNTFPNLEEINFKIRNTIGHEFRLQEVSFNFSYKYITYACAIKEINDQEVHIKLFEGFWWWPGRIWSQGHQPGVVAMDGPTSANYDDMQVFKNTINNFFQTLNINVNWF